MSINSKSQQKIQNQQPTYNILNYKCEHRVFATRVAEQTNRASFKIFLMNNYIFDEYNYI